MSITLWISGLLVTGLALYLVFALLRPEWFA